MSRRRAVWIALTVGMVTVVALVLAGRRSRRPVVAATAWAPDPGPNSIAATATSTGDAMEASTEAILDSGAPATGQVAVEQAEHPLAMWIRLTIVGVALLAFLAVSLLATKGV